MAPKSAALSVCRAMVSTPSASKPAEMITRSGSKAANHGSASPSRQASHSAHPDPAGWGQFNTLPCFPVSSARPVLGKFPSSCREQ